MFTTHVAGAAGSIRATGVECLSCTISNSPAGGSGRGKLKITGVTVVNPAACTTSPSIESKELGITADYVEGSTNLVELEGTSPGTFATFPLSGSSCPVWTTIKFWGRHFGEFWNAAGVLANEQRMKLGSISNVLAGADLHLGTEPAYIDGEVILKGSESYGIK